LHTLYDGGTDKAPPFGHFAHFHFSPATALKLSRIFGNEHALSVTRAAAAAAEKKYLVRLRALDFLDTDGTKLEWSELTSTVSIDKTGRKVSGVARWPALAISGKQHHLSLRDMRFSTHHTHEIGGMTFGRTDASVADLSWNPSNTSTPIQFEDMRASTVMLRRGKVADLDYRVSVKSATFDGERFDGIHLALRMLNLDPKTMGVAGREIQSLNVAGQTQEEQVASMLLLFNRDGADAVRKGATLVFDDWSASYHGNKFSVKGRIGFDKAARPGRTRDSVLESFMKIVAHFDVRVPVALLRDFAAAVPRNVPGGEQPVSGAAAALAARDKADALIAKAVGDGYARLVNGELRSAIDFKGGKLSFNGKHFPLPGE